MPLLRFFTDTECHPRMDVCPSVHSSRVFAFIVREWTLVRCGINHSLMDVLPVTSLKPSLVCVVLLCGALFTPCAPACSCVLWRRAWAYRSHFSVPTAVERLATFSALALLTAAPLRRCRPSVNPHAHCGWRVSSPAFFVGKLESVIRCGTVARSFFLCYFCDGCMQLGGEP